MGKDQQALIPNLVPGTTSWELTNTLLNLVDSTSSLPKPSLFPEPPRKSTAPLLPRPLLPLTLKKKTWTISSVILKMKMRQLLLKPETTPLCSEVKHSRPRRTPPRWLQVRHPSRPNP